jgi:flagellar M-ring protein FliF
VNRVVLHRVVPAGQLQRVSAAILVDDAVVKNVAGGKVTFARHARSQATLNQIQQLAQAVIGFDAKRGDTISVQDMSFATDDDGTSADVPGLAERVQKTVSNYSSLLRPMSLLVLFLMAYLFVLRPIQKQALGPGATVVAEPAVLRAPATAEQLALGVTAPADATLRAGQLKEQTIEMIKQKPADTTRAVQAWLREATL